MTLQTLQTLPALAAMALLAAAWAGTLFGSASVASEPGAAAPGAMRGYLYGEMEKDGTPAPREIMTRERDVVTLRLAGRESYGGSDEGAFAGFETDALAFELVARVARAPEGLKDPKYGVVIRESLRKDAKCVQLRYDGYEGNRCLQWFMRHERRPTDPDGGKRCFMDGTIGDADRDSDVWLKLVRRYPFVDLLWSHDGKDWKAVPYRAVYLPARCWIGLQATAGAKGLTEKAVAFDNVRYRVLDATTTPGAPEDYASHPLPKRTWRMILRQVPSCGDKGEGIEAAAFLLMPTGMDPDAIRGLFYSCGSKEILLDDGQTLRYDKGPGKRRKPVAMEAWEGVHDFEDAGYHGTMLEQEGLIRLGGTFLPRDLPAVLAALREASGFAFLENLPLVATGNSFAGGQSAQTAALYPEKTVAVAPVVIGQAGSKTNEHAVLDTPHLHIFGTKDGSHLKDAEEWIPKHRARKALWGSAPMWTLQHRQYKADAILHPYFFETLRLRLPEDFDPAQGPVALKPLAEAEGWFGLLEGWDGQAPAILPVGEKPEEAVAAAWLPNERIAKVWRAFSSNHPATAILYPAFEGFEPLMGRPQPGKINTVLKAGAPFRLLAAGPAGEDLHVEYHTARGQLEPTAIHDGNPFHVTLPGLPTWTHVLYLKVTRGETVEYTRPVLVLVAP